MGSGKTTIGKLLADALSIQFYDTDQEIEHFAQVDITTLFNQSGEAHFRALESLTIERLITEHENAVIATGGGLPCNDKNMESMKRAGIVIYLKCDTETLFKRIQTDIQERPLKKNNEQELAVHLAAREEFYAHASIVADGNVKAKEVARRILEML